VWTEYALSALVTLAVVVDPIGLAPAFLSITQSMPQATRRTVAWRAAVIAALILFGTALIGNWLLARLGISLPAFRIAGGLLLFAVSFEMALGVRQKRETNQAEQAVEEHARDVAAFPLAMPLMAGPGAITATLLLAGRANFDMTLMGVLFAIIVVVCLGCVLVFLAATRISRTLGNTGNIVLSRLLGVMLAALAVQFVVDGVRALMSQA
jgi:multiple antibiotic resistance protein